VRVTISYSYELTVTEENKMLAMISFDETLQSQFEYLAALLREMDYDLTHFSGTEVFLILVNSIICRTKPNSNNVASLN